VPGQVAAGLKAKAAPEHNRLPRDFQGKVLVFRKRRFIRELSKNMFLIILAFLLSRFMLPGGIVPAGISFGLVNVNRRMGFWKKFLIAIAIFLGIGSVKGFVYAGWIAGSIVLLDLLNQLWKRRKNISIKWLWSFLIWSFLRFALLGLVGATRNLLIITLLELTFVYFLGLLFQIAIKFLDNPLKEFSKNTSPVLAVMIVFALGGAKDMVFQSLNLTEILAAFLLTTVSFVGGGGAGAAMGILIGLVLGIKTENVITQVATYSIAGCLGGFLRQFRRWGTMFGAAFGLYFVLQQLHIAPFTIHNISWGIGMLSFALIPRNYISQISNYFPEPQRTVTEEQQQLREYLTNQMNNLSDIFGEMAKSFNDGKQEAATLQKTDLYTLLDQVCTKNCQHCTGYESCWGENFYSTYREIFDLIAVAELYGKVNLKNLKGRLAKNCFQQFKLLATINQLFEKCLDNNLWQQKIDENKAFLANQLQGVSGIISSLATQINSDVNFKTEIAEKIYQGFQRIGIPVKEAAVITYNQQGLEICIRQHNCGQSYECQYLAAAMISRLLDREYMVWERKCRQLMPENEDCQFSLIPTRNYEIKTSICKLPKNGNEFSGDNQGLHELKEGQFVAILSDGMGHGTKASVESETTVAILEKLLESGIDSDFAVKMVNSVLLLRSSEESFATVDLAVIDLYTAQAEFIKIGAAATYIKRGRELWSIESTSLPAGILSAVDLERTNVKLESGDLVIMVTDGIIDSKPNHPDKEDWMIRALRQVEVVGPEALGEYLLNLATINQNGEPKDDMTVIIMQILAKMF
jgi:stage II sporulation protein E